MEHIKEFIIQASEHECLMIDLALVDRLNKLAAIARNSTANANLEEAAGFLKDAAKDIQDAIKSPVDEICRCGMCDACIAARSDEHHDRKVDGELMRGSCDES